METPFIETHYRRKPQVSDEITVWDTDIMLFGLNLDKPEVTRDLDHVDQLSSAYAVLQEEIHSTTQATNNHLVETLGYKVMRIAINDQARHIMYPSISTNSQQVFTFDYNDPEPVQDYFCHRDSAYTALLHDAVTKNDFEPIMSTITTYNESDLARDLLARYRENRAIPATWLSGIDRDVHNKTVNANNDRVTSFKKSVGMYALKCSGVPLVKSRAIRKHFIEPLTKIASHKSVVEQLIDREVAGRAIVYRLGRD